MQRFMVSAAVVATVLVAGTGLSSRTGLSQTARTAALPDLPEKLEKARGAADKYALMLKQQLHEALKNGGPKSAVGACTTIASDLAGDISEETSVEIGRTAMRIRNPDNQADPFEIAGLEYFLRQLSAGSEPAKLEFYDLTTTQVGQKLFRYMRPIMTRESCLACHGVNISPEIRSEIAKTYPDDKAVGYSVGELRGAFTTIQQVD